MSTRAVNWDEYLQVAALSDIGMRRRTNQDSMAVGLASDLDQWRRHGHLFLVADGMGAHAAGELASELAVDTIPHLYRKYSDQGPVEALRRAVLETNDEINRRGQANEDFRNMGTTCTTLLLLPHQALIAHIGDSRAYRMRSHRMEQLTFDHSLQWEMRAATNASLSDDEHTSMIPKNVITRSLGPNADVKVDIEGPFPLQPGDTFLLCSDGLSGQVSDEELGTLLEHLPPQEAIRVLIDLANLRGGPDNITAMIIKVNQTLNNSRNGARNGPSDHSRSPSGIEYWAPWLMLIGFVIAAAVVGVLTQRLVWAAVTALGAGAALLWLLLRLRPGGAGESASQPVSGHAPYTQTDCTAGTGVISKLEELVQQLRDGAEQQHWSLNWTTVEPQLAAARQAGQAGDTGAAVRGYTSVLTMLMNQLRESGET